MKIQINFTLKIVPDTHEPWKLTAPVHFRSTHKRFPVCFPFSGFPSTCCLNYPPYGPDTDSAFPSHMNARLSVAPSRLQLLPRLRQLLAPPLLLPSAGLQTLVISSPPPMMTSARDDPQLQQTSFAEKQSDRRWKRAQLCAWLRVSLLPFLAKCAFLSLYCWTSEPGKLITLWEESHSPLNVIYRKQQSSACITDSLPPWLMEAFSGALLQKLVKDESIFLLPWLRLSQLRSLSPTIPPCADFSVLRRVENANLFMPH